jgi:2,3-dihydroxybenzoate-AMP ligase
VDTESGFDHRELAAEVAAALPDLAVFVVGEPGEFTDLSDVDADPMALDDPWRFRRSPPIASPARRTSRQQG